MPAIEFENVELLRDSKPILASINWSASTSERWVILGPNGSGKTSLLKLAGAQQHPSTGIARVLGNQLGRVDLRELRKRIAFVSASTARQISPDTTVRDVVLSGKDAALVSYWSEFTRADIDRADGLARDLDLVELQDRGFGVISEGERQRTLLARSLMSSPELLLLDEPFAGLDLGARERLLARLGDLFADQTIPACVLVTHHVEEIPPGTTHALLLRNGSVVRSGMIAEVLTSDTISETFEIPVHLSHDGNRWRCVAR